MFGKKLLICLILAAGITPSVSYSKEQVRILAIGNSFSQDAVEQYLYELFDAAGMDAVIGNMYIGGCRLDTHWANAQSDAEAYEYRKVVNGKKTESKNVSLSAAIEDEVWDIITFQQASGSSGVYSTYTPYLQNLIDWASEKSEADLWFHQTWAYASGSNHAEFPKYNSDQLTMYNAIMESVENAMKDHPRLKGVIPSGTAIQNARTSFLGDSFNRDGYHLETTYGRYTAACTWFEALTGESVVGNSYAPASVDIQMKNIAQNAAHAAVTAPFQVTELVDFKSPQVQEGPLRSPVKVDFGSNSADASWNSVGTIDGKEIILKDSQGVYTQLSMTIDPAFDSAFGGVGTEPDSDIESGGIVWPKKAWADSFVVNGTQGNGDSREACITINGLDVRQTFNVTVLSTRFNGTYTARQAGFRLEGDSTGEGTLNCGIRIGTGAGQFTSWETVPFEDYTLSFENMAPAQNGSFKLYVKGKDVGSVVEGYISALVLAPNGELNALDKIRMASEGAVYNVYGQRVDDSYRGIVINNGRKYIRR